MGSRCSKKPKAKVKGKNKVNGKASRMRHKGMVEILVQAHAKVKEGNAHESISIVN